MKYRVYIEATDSEGPRYSADARNLDRIEHAAQTLIERWLQDNRSAAATAYYRPDTRLMARDISRKPTRIGWATKGSGYERQKIVVVRSTGPQPLPAPEPPERRSNMYQQRIIADLRHQIYMALPPTDADRQDLGRLPAKRAEADDQIRQLQEQLESIKDAREQEIRLQAAGWIIFDPRDYSHPGQQIIRLTEGKAGKIEIYAAINPVHFGDVRKRSAYADTWQELITTIAAIEAE